MIDAATGAIHIFQTHARALDGFRKFPKFHVELSPYGRPGVLVEIDSQSSDVSLNPELIKSNLSDEQESRLRELFAEGQAEGQIAEAQTTT